MLACPCAVAAMALADRLASRAVDGSAAPRIVARGGAIRYDRTSLPLGRDAEAMRIAVIVSQKELCLAVVSMCEF